MGAGPDTLRPSFVLRRRATDSVLQIRGMKRAWKDEGESAAGSATTTSKGRASKRPATVSLVLPTNLPTPGNSLPLLTTCVVRTAHMYVDTICSCCTTITEAAYCGRALPCHRSCTLALNATVPRRERGHQPSGTTSNRGCVVLHRLSLLFHFPHYNLSTATPLILCHPPRVKSFSVVVGQHMMPVRARQR